MTDRKPARDRYDAVVDLLPHDGLPECAVAWVKIAYAHRSGRWELAPADPLLGDDRDASSLDLGSRNSDFRPFKPHTDVLVYGEAQAVDRKKVAKLNASIRLGGINKDVSVIGIRRVEWKGSIASITPPEPFESMPLDWEHAYGGIDVDMPVPREMAELMAEGIALGHPGIYPRNPHGKGYFVGNYPREDAELPNLEDPSTPLTLDNLFARLPTEWWRQPLPWCFEPTFLGMFPRPTLMGSFPADPPPRDDRDWPETQRGFWIPGLLERLRSNPLLFGFFHQEASHGMILPEAVAGTRGVITGMTADELEFRFEVPPTPRIDITLDGKKTRVPAKMTSLVLRPNEKKMTATFAAVLDELPRAFVPGMFRDIPLSVSVDGDTAIQYETPPTVQDLASQARR